jgi:2-C-methyl-D-erythritol 2,4-cyclodiphosphate synthase
VKPRKKMRVGFGYDIHRMVEGRSLVLGGVKVPYTKGLKGHSDADVLLHAVCDALLGAAGQDDLGAHFPDTDPAYKDISSLELLRRVYQIISQAGFIINNVDTTVVLEAPRLGPFKKQMCANIAETLFIEVSQVSVKATTGEGMGMVGRGKAAMAYCVCSLR